MAKDILRHSVAGITTRERNWAYMGQNMTWNVDHPPKAQQDTASSTWAIDIRIRDALNPPTGAIGGGIGDERISILTNGTWMDEEDVLSLSGTGQVMRAPNLSIRTHVHGDHFDHLNTLHMPL